MQLINKMVLGVMETALQNQVFILDNQRLLVKSLTFMTKDLPSDGSDEWLSILCREKAMLEFTETNVKLMKQIFDEKVEISNQ